MDKEAMQRQLEDLEQASERWRAERRRLNAEIDKLESALADAKTTVSRKRGSATEEKPQAIDPALINKIQETADEKFKRATEEWEAERTKLTSQINRLEGALTEAIARASNPLRVTQSVKEQFEIELNRIAKEKTDIEQAFLRAKTEWEQEKLKMTGEMVKLRRNAQIMGRALPKEEMPEINPKVRDLENQLQTNLSQWNAEREKLVAQIQKFEETSRQWDAERRTLNGHAGHLQQAFLEMQAKVQQYEVAARQATPSEAKLEEIQREKDALQRQLQESRNEWDTERRQMSSQIDQLETQLHRVSENRDRVSNDVLDQLRQQYERKLQEAIQQKTQLADELKHASSLLESERQRWTSAQKDNGGGLSTEEINAEVARVESQLNDIVSVIENPNTELSTIIRKNVEKAELDAYLKGIFFALGKK